MTHNHTHHDYFTNIYAHGFTQLISTTTRIQGNTVSLIDHILTNSNQNLYESGVIISDISDHFPVFTIIPSNTKNKQAKHAFSRSFSHANVEKFREKLANTDWAMVTSKNDVNECYTIFWEKFSNHYNDCFQLKKSKFNKNIHRINSYMTQELLNSRKEKLALHKKALQAPTPENIQRYKQYRNEYNNLVRLSKKRYFEEGLQQARKNPRKSWELINPN